MKINEVISTINDDWFNQSSIRVAKKANPIQYKRAIEPGSIETLEGPVDYQAGFYIITGPKGEEYPIPPAKFNELYNDNKDNTATPKKIIKVAKLADHDGVVNTSWDLEDEYMWKGMSTSYIKTLSPSTGIGYLMPSSR